MFVDIKMKLSDITMEYIMLVQIQLQDKKTRFQIQITIESKEKEMLYVIEIYFTIFLQFY
jgi:hypothetical protein